MGGHFLVVQFGVGDLLSSRRPKHISCCGVSEVCWSHTIALPSEFVLKRLAITSELSLSEREHFTTSIKVGKLWSDGFTVLTLPTPRSSSNFFQPAAKVRPSR